VAPVTQIRNIRQTGLDGPGWELMETPSTFEVNPAKTSMASNNAILTTPSGPGFQTMATLMNDMDTTTILDGPGWQTVAGGDSSDMTDLPEDLSMDDEKDTASTLSGPGWQTMAVGDSSDMTDFTDLPEDLSTTALPLH